MFLHIVLFKFRDGITSDDSRVRLAVDQMRDLPARVREIRSWTHGFNISDRPIAYDYGLVASFDKEKDIKVYLNHPDHQVVTDLWSEFSDWKVCDIAL